MMKTSTQKSAVQNGNVEPGGYKLNQARVYLGGISTPSIHRLIRRGLLRPNRNLRHLIFSRQELDRFLKDGMSE
jgi:hypothetical protein